MAFTDPVRPDIENVRAGERWNDSGIILTATDFQDGLIIGRFAQLKSGVISNMDGTATPVVAGVVLRSVTNAIESGSTYDADLHRECEYKRDGLVTVDVAAGVTPTQFAKCYVVNTAGSDIGKATTSASGLSINAEFIAEVQPGVWLVNINCGIHA